MKIFEVVKIAETLDIKQVGGVWRIIDTKTGDFANKIIYNNPGEAEAARDKIKSKLSAKNDNKKPEKFSGKKEPTLSKEPFKTDPGPGGTRKDGTPRKEPKLTGPTTPKPPFPKGTPTMDDLPGYKNKKLFDKPGKFFTTFKRTDKIEYKGKTYTADQIKAATDAANAAKTKTAKDKSKLGKAGDITKKYAGKIGKLVLNVLSMKFAWLVSLGLNIAAFEDDLDAYLRAIKRTADEAGDEASRKKLANDLKEGIYPRKIAVAYTNAIESLTAGIVEAVIAAILALGTPYAVAKLLALAFPAAVATGGIAVIAGVVAGIGAVIFGPKLLTSLFDAVGWMDKLENIIGDVISPQALISGAEGMDFAQDILGVYVGWTGYTPDAPANESKEIVNEKEIYDDPQALKSALIKWIKSDPDAQEAYLAGKEEGKKIAKKLKGEMNT